MEKFGFVIQNNKSIDLDKCDKSLFNRILTKEADILKCIACGCCTASCTAGNFTDVSFRRIILLLERGDIELVKKMTSECMLCGKCILVCPRGINTRNILKEIILIKS